MKISVIIAYYKNLPALSLILQGLEKQSVKDFEVIVAEDDNEKETVKFITNQIENTSFKIKHIQQKEDDGFRKNEILNKAIKNSDGEFIVFIDGDVIPHKHFIKEYSKSIEDGVALFGRRVMLSENLTNDILDSQNLNLLGFTNLVCSKSKRIKYSLYLPFIKSFRETGIWGCNWGILKQNLIEINGFDEDYIKAGVGEDVDIEWRLKQNGIKLLSIRFGAIVYHLHHKVNYSGEDVKNNFNLFDKKKNDKHIYCVNGLIKNNH